MAKKRRVSPGALIPVEAIERRIHLLRGQKIMIDADLAEIYQVLTKNLNLAVKRNMSRFPPDFMFQLTQEEFENLRLQFATSSSAAYGGRRYLPYAFTEHGVAMLSSVLHSERAVQMNILVVRAFIRMRDLLISHKDLAVRMTKLEAPQEYHGSIIVAVVDEIKRLKAPRRKKAAIGFRVPAA